MGVCNGMCKYLKCLCIHNNITHVCIDVGIEFYIYIIGS